MTNAPRFNYIITIHNKEDLIEEVLVRVLMCCRDRSHVYPVIDGCTDRTEEIIDRVAGSLYGAPITKVHTPNVHELLSINAGLRAANQEGDGYNIILQDDVLLGDLMLESKVAALYEWAGPTLGYVSFRLGANFAPDAATSDEPVPYVDYVESACGHGIDGADVLLPGHFAYRSVSIKSPVCIPFRVVRSVGTFEEKLAPYGHDDLEYSIRQAQHGLRCGVFCVAFKSDVKWGGTRTTPHPELTRIIRRNMGWIRQSWGPELAALADSDQPRDVVRVQGLGDVRNEATWKATWERSRLQLEGIDPVGLKLRAAVMARWRRIWHLK